MIHLDTSFLVDALTGSRRSGRVLRQAVAQGENFEISAVVLYEWLRGPRSMKEIEDQESLFPSDSILPFEDSDARIGSMLYRSVKRPRSREADIAIAATAIRHRAQLWTLNPGDFADIPGLQLYKPR